MFPEKGFRRIHRVDLFAALEDADVRDDRLLLSVLDHLHLIVAHGVGADGHLLAERQHLRDVTLVGVAGKPEEDQHDADVDDVATVAAFVPGDEADERREQVGTGILTPHVRAPPEFLCDRPRHKRAQSEARQRGPLPDADGRQRADGDHQRADRPGKLVDQVLNRRLPPREQRAKTSQEQQYEADRQHPLVEKRQTDGHSRAGHGFTQRREHRRERDEERGEQQNPVVREKCRLAGEP